MIVENIEELIGNTPLLKIDGAQYGLRSTDIYIKLEYLNPFGSIKDRTALWLTKEIDFAALKKADGNLIESSSGNTAKALQMIALRHGVRLTSVTNRIKIPEVSQQLTYLQTELINLPGRSECPDPDDENNAVAVIDRMVDAQPDKYIHTRQYTNPANPAAHEMTTARELYDELGEVDVCITGVGTAGSSGGIVEYARKHQKTTKFIGVVAHPSDFLPGIRNKTELFETALFHKSAYEEIVEVDSHAALNALWQLVEREGVLAGPTTGGNFAAALEYLTQHDTTRADGSKQAAVVVACDRLEPYMSYIMQRCPERFGIERDTGVFTVRVSDEDRLELEKQPSPETQLWIEQESALVVDIRGLKPMRHFRLKGSACYPEELLREMLLEGNPLPSDKPVLFVCPRGDRSSIYAKLLRDKGVEAYSLAGGLMAWRASGLPYERG